ncbi:hypothetical protein [Rhizobium sp. SYY.PMSO]|uniref:hypothetical protein n=1 Tax=Rhizobium sp. SYY.PMSO TaxID=3382192 RepID=UPI00398FD2CB
MISTEPAYVIRQEDNGTFSVVDSKTGRVAVIGGCVLGKLDAAMAAGLAEDLNGPKTYNEKAGSSEHP